MSGAQTSTFPTMNELLAPMAAYDTHANQLLQQQVTQQDISGHQIEMGARLASTLLDPTAYPTTEARAAAYPGLVARARAQFPGYFTNAPDTYPGDAATQALARMGTPSQTQQEWQANIAANKAYTAATNPPAVAPATTTGGSATAAAPATSGTIEPDALTRAQAVRDGLIKRGLDVDTATGFAANALHESGANPNTRPGDAGASHGTFMWNADRYNRYIAINGHPPDNAPLDEQLDFVVHELGTTEGAARDRIAAAQGPAAKAAAVSQFYLRPKDVQPEMARRSATATQLATQWGGAGTSTAAPVITGDSLASSGGLGGNGVVGDSSAKVLARVQAESRAGKYDGKPVVLSTGASNDFGTDLGSVEQQIREAQAGNAGKITVLGVGPAVEAKAPGTNAKLQALSKAYGADFVPLPADQMSPDGVHPTAQGYAALKAAIAPAQGAPGGPTADGRYQVASNAPVAPPATATPAAAPRVDSPGAPAAGGLKYNMNSQGAPPGTILGYLPNGNAVLAGPADTHVGITGWNADGTPIRGGAPAATPQPQAQIPQPPANRVMPGAPDGPPAPAPQPAAPAGGPQPPQLAPLNAAGLTPIQQRQIDAYAADPRVPLDKRMAAQQAFANQNIQLAQKAFSDYVQLQQLAVSQGQLTNAQAETNLKYWQAAHPELAPNAREATIAFRTLQELAPAMRTPNPPQDVVDRYNNAAIAYQDFKTQKDPISKQLVQAPTRPLPDGFPQPSGAAGGSGVRPLTQGLSPAQQQVERDPAAYKVSETQYTNDAQDVRPLAEAGRQAQADQVRIKEMQDVLQRFSTGSGTEARTAAAAFLQRWLPASITGWEKESANLSGAEAAQAFSKLALVGAGTQERGVLGARGGYQAIKLFKDANPSVNLQDATNKSILDMQLISNQANQDYTQAALSHFADNEKKFAATHQYDSLTQFDRNWNAQRNPQVYAAAMGAVSGQLPEQWTKGLSDAEYDRALQIVSRANPSAVVNTKSGRYSMQPQAVSDGTQIKSNDTVIRYDRSGNRIP